MKMNLNASYLLLALSALSTTVSACTITQSRCIRYCNESGGFCIQYRGAWCCVNPY
ncbi:putative amino-acid permease [Venturia inaequalis]|nr:putative amino-acid permease [Venturia inaequalis]